VRKPDFCRFQSSPARERGRNFEAAAVSSYFLSFNPRPRVSAGATSLLQRNDIAGDIAANARTCVFE
jgi:hypothetical protein